MAAASLVYDNLRSFAGPLPSRPPAGRPTWRAEPARGGSQNGRPGYSRCPVRDRTWPAWPAINLRADELSRSGGGVSIGSFGVEKEEEESIY